MNHWVGLEPCAIEPESQNTSRVSTMTESI